MFEAVWVASIDKVMPNEAPKEFTGMLEGFRNERVSVQLAFRAPDRDRMYVALRLETELSVHVRRVKYIPVRLPALPDVDDNYLNDKKPGLYPDVLQEINPHGIRAFAEHWEALWLDVLPGEGEGEQKILAVLTDEETGEELVSKEILFRRLPAELPPQELIHTKWLHTDSLASHYDFEVFSEEYWRVTENFIRSMAEHGINTVLTPVHTPPLDTRVGTYRRTVQLVDVEVVPGGYRFGFDKLERWVEICKRCGIEYYEIAHLFTQWGARFAPQIHAKTQEGSKRIFGWDTPATGEAYTAFLSAYLPALLDEMEKLGVADKTLFHISDEPSAEHLQDYLAAKALVQKHLRGQKIIDALSDVRFYDCGAVEHPVPATSHIEPFLERKIPWLWTYYCIGQGTDVSNLFVSMPGERTRVFGAQLYKFDIAGILQWGFNFYFSQYADYPINPYWDTDCDGFTPAGDAWQVYPGKDGKPEDSLRLLLVHEAIQDLRAMRLLEKLTSRETVLKLIDEGIEPITFSKYPRRDYVLPLRKKINAAIVAALK